MNVSKCLLAKNIMCIKTWHKSPMLKNFKLLYVFAINYNMGKWIIVRKKGDKYRKKHINVIYIFLSQDISND